MSTAAAIERIATHASAEIRNLLVRARLRIHDLERENAELEHRNLELERRLAMRVAPTNRRYVTEEERVEAARRCWRESKRRSRIRQREAA